MRIYIGNFGFDTSEQEVRQAFEAHGQVQEVSMMKDRDTGRSKGFAFVEMPTQTEALAAINTLNGQDFGGRPATVNEARPRPERSAGGLVGTVAVAAAAAVAVAVAAVAVAGNSVI